MLSQKIPLEEMNNQITLPVDVFICCSSFEKRCTVVAESFDTSNIGNILIAQNENNLRYVGENGGKLSLLLGEKSEIVEINTDDPIRTTDSLIKALKHVIKQDSQNFLVDITTFTRESLLILLRLLRQYLKRSDSLQFVYVGAKQYSGISEGNTEDIWLSKGILEVRSVLGYAGESLPTRDLHLVVLVGFEYERAYQLIESYEPSLLSLGYSEDATELKHAEKNREFHRKISSFYNNVSNFIFSATDPIKTMHAIAAQQQLHSEFNTVVAPMNTKLSTVGAALAAFCNPSIQLCYAQAETYNVEKYSEPQKFFYLFEPDLEHFVV